MLKTDKEINHHHQHNNLYYQPQRVFRASRNTFPKFNTVVLYVTTPANIFNFISD